MKPNLGNFDRYKNKQLAGDQDDLPRNAAPRTSNDAIRSGKPPTNVRVAIVKVRLRPTANVRPSSLGSSLSMATNPFRVRLLSNN